MSAWQFRIEILPVDGLVARHGAVPKELAAMKLSDAGAIDDGKPGTDELPRYWRGYLEFGAFETAIGGLLPERESWSELARMFGVNGEDEAAIWRAEDGSVSRISLSFSLREPNVQFIHSALDCASSFKCVFHGIQSHQIFSPSMAEFVAHAEKCSAARFVPTEKPLSSMLA